MFLLLWAWVQSVVRGIKIQRTIGVAKIKRKKKERERIAVPSNNITYFFEKKKL